MATWSHDHLLRSCYMCSLAFAKWFIHCMSIGLQDYKSCNLLIFLYNNGTFVTPIFYTLQYCAVYIIACLLTQNNSHSITRVAYVEKCWNFSYIYTVYTLVYNISSQYILHTCTCVSEFPKVNDISNQCIRNQNGRSNIDASNDGPHLIFLTKSVRSKC